MAAKEPHLEEPTAAEKSEIGVSSGWPYMPDELRARRALVDWAKAHRLRYMPKARCEHWLRGGRCATGSEEVGGWRDHMSGWTRDGEPAVLMAQPYDVNEDDLVELDELSAEGFNVQMDLLGGWYSDRTAFIAVWKLDPNPG